MNRSIARAGRRELRAAWRMTLFTTLLLGVAGCGPDRERVLGQIYLNPGDEPWEVPESAAAGETFLVTIFTTGHACYRAGPTEVDRQGSTVIITPYDWLLEPPGDGCLLKPETFVHQVELQSDEPGVVVLVLHARHALNQEIVELEEVVQITP